MPICARSAGTQSKYESGNLSPHQAAYALKFAYDNCLPFHAALESTIMQAISVVNPNLLGEILLAARLISEFQLAVAMDQARDCGLTLGRVFAAHANNFGSNFGSVR